MPIIQAQNLKKKVKIQLPGSKSISNRLLILSAVGNFVSDFKNLSKCDDVQVLNRILHSNSNVFHVHESGTALRFLTALMSGIVGKWELTGSERIKQRPVKSLVDALRDMGANIEYMENDGYAPLQITGTKMKGGSVEIDISESSQYASAILLIAPMLETGLKLKLGGDARSLPYIDITLAMMNNFGVEAIRYDREVLVMEGQEYKPQTYSVEADWSAAAFWYELVAINPQISIKLMGLNRNSNQGDRDVVRIFKHLGVESHMGEQHITVTGNKSQISILQTNISQTPDMFPALFASCIARRQTFEISGTANLSIKECDRVEAMRQVAEKMGVHVSVEPDMVICDRFPDYFPDTIEVDVFNDHRIAMSVAPLACIVDRVFINDETVVNKSYPEFWSDMKKAGINCC